jgi:hypothetical protein
MTVGTLIGLLSQYDKDTEVVFMDPGGLHETNPQYTYEAGRDKMPKVIMSEHELGRPSTDQVWYVVVAHCVGQLDRRKGKSTIEG